MSSSPSDAPTPSEGEVTKTLAERIRPVPEVAEPQHADIAVWRAATPDDTDALMELAIAADAVDHPTWVTPRDEIEELFTMSHIDPNRQTRIGLSADGRALAFAGVVINPAQDVHVYAYLGGRVHPAVRRRGIGREILRWELDTARRDLAATGSTLPAAIFLYGEEHDAGARALGAQAGLVEERWFTTMVRPMTTEIPEVGTAAEIIAYTSDWQEAARVARNDAFRDHWGSLEVTPERWDRFVSGSHFRGDLSRLVIAEGRVLAFALSSVHEDDWAAQGYTSAYVELIGVVRDQRGRRLAPAVIVSMLAAVRDAGLEKAVLDVDTESPTGANSLYGSLGFEPTHRTVSMVARY